MRHLFSRIWNQSGAGLLNYLGWNTHHTQFTYIKVGFSILKFYNLDLSFVNFDPVFAGHSISCLVWCENGFAMAYFQVPWNIATLIQTEKLKES